MKTIRHIIIFGVIFENKYVPFDAPIEDARRFYNKSNIYTYKTNKDYKKGQVVHIIGPSGLNRVMIVNPMLKEEEIKFPIDKIKLLEEA